MLNRLKHLSLFDERGTDSSLSLRMTKKDYQNDKGEIGLMSVIFYIPSTCFNFT